MARPSASGSYSATQKPSTYRFGEFRVEVNTGKLLRGNTLVQLPSRAFDALLYLIEHRDRVVRKDDIIASVWHDVVVTDDSLIHVVSVLRRELGDDRHDAKFIETIPRRGYRFIGPVDAADAPAEPSLPAAGEAAAKSAATRTMSWPRSMRLVWPVVGAAVAGVIVLISLAGSPSPFGAGVEPRAIRLAQPSPPGRRIVSSGALSPDGRYLAFVARDDTNGQTALWVRTLHSQELRQLDGTTGASKPFWAPDSHRVAFFANGELLAVDLATQQRRRIAAVAWTATGGSWGPDDTILFADWTTGLYAVDAAGENSVETIIEVDRTQDDIAIAWPQFLPDGRHFLYQRVNLDPARTGTYIGDLNKSTGRRLIDTESAAVFAPPRHVLHVQKDMLIAEELDMDRLELSGRATVVARGISAPTIGEDGLVSVSGNLLAFRNGIKRQNLAWFSRTGEQLGVLSMPAVLFNPRVSPDESRVLATTSITSDAGLWLASLSREVYVRLETDASAPLWSPDGGDVAFTSRDGFDVIVRPVNDWDANRVLVADDAAKVLNDWSPNGEEIVYTRVDERGNLDLWTVRVDDAEARPLVATSFNELHARISPDGNWIAYSSDESGTLEVYVQRYPELGDKRKVSVAGGGQPQWRSDQRELFYLSADRAIIAVDIEPAENTIIFDAPHELFRARSAGDPKTARDHYAASADGTRFLIDTMIQSGDANDSVITIIVNWKNGDDQRDVTRSSEAVSQLYR